MIAEIIAAGSEMLTPHRQDTNSLFLTERLNTLGVSVAFKTIVGDNLDHLTAAARTALHRADIVLFSGGLGPTEDDLTREAAAAALGIGLHADADILQLLEARFAARGTPMPHNNLRQANVLVNAEILPNKNGTAPGQYLDLVHEHHRRIVILLPGPPSELKPMFDAQVQPRLAATLPPNHIATRQLRMSLLPESQVDARTAPIYKRFPDVETTILAGNAEIQLHFAATKPTQDEAEARIAELSALIEQELLTDIFSTNGDPLEQVVLNLLAENNQTLATAESCTGGLIAQRITARAGSSSHYLGGAVVYSNALKQKFANVPATTLAQHGAVSRETAQALAEGIRQQTGATLGLSVTGIAGPDGGTPEKPVGLVYIALATPTSTEVKQLNLTGDRDRIRWWTSQHALELIRRKLL